MIGDASAKIGEVTKLKVSVNLNNNIDFELNVGQYYKLIDITVTLYRLIYLKLM